MHSLNQVNKLVSCGRDPARSLPLWRGFLLIPLILVCFAFAPNAQTAPAPETPDPGAVGGTFSTADGLNALLSVTTGAGNSAFGWFSSALVTTGSFNTSLGAGTLLLNQGDSNTAVGTIAMLLNATGTRNTAVGEGTLVFSGQLGNPGADFNGAFGAEAMFNNSDGFSNNAMGDSALHSNVHGAENTAVGDLALVNNDATESGASFNTAVGSQALSNNDTGVGNTGVGQGVGPNLVAGFNNTYIGSLVGTNADDEDLTIRIGDISADGFGSAACFIGGIFNNEQPVGGNVVVVTLNLDTDQLGFDPGAARSGNAPAAPHRNAPQPRSRPQPQHQAMLNDKVEKLQATVAQQQTTVTEQQKQIETLTSQLREQAAQIQKVSAQLEIIRPTPRVVENR